MKKHSIYTYFVTVLIGLVSLASLSCENNDSEDTTPPGVVTIKQVIPTHGGAKITFTLPNDNDVLFVKGKYTNSLGKEVFKASSIYNDTLELDGFNDTKEHSVNVYAVDKHNNHSAPVKVNFTPLQSYIHMVKESIRITPDLGGVKVEWENSSAKTVHVYLLMKTESSADSIIISSYLPHYETYIRGLDSLEYEFFAKVEDFPGNKTEQVFVAKAKPKFEQKIDKNTWTLVSNLSVDGNAYEGLTENFWDDVVDTKESPDDNSYFMISRDNNGGELGYPMDIVIDMNKQIVVNRLIVWQRAFDYENRTADNVSEIPYYYQSENLRKFDIFYSNDLETWTLAGNFDIGDPKDIDGVAPKDAIIEAEEGHMFVLDQTTSPFRYMKFSITSNFGSEIYINGSELTLFGLDNVE